VETALRLVALNAAQFAAVVALFLPGFVSLKIDGLIHPGRALSASERVIEIIGYSLLNAGVFSWLILLVAFDLQDSVPSYLLLVPSGFLICVLGPTAWPVIFRAFQSFLAKRGVVVGPHRFAWDNVFARRNYGFVQVHLNDGSIIGGYFGEASYATVEPESGHLYLEELWSLDANARFVARIPDSRGALFRPTDYQWVEFFEDDIDEV
jgi:hypothetical protein